MSDLHYFQPAWIEKSDQRLRVDICIYGATSAGVIAAVEARTRGKSVALLQPGKFVGGLTSGGLGFTDYGVKEVIGGWSREFYRRVGSKYGKAEEFQFDPHVASDVFQEMLAEHQITPMFCQYLDRVQSQAGRITEITLLGGLRVAAMMYIDASYEGDLLAKAGVTYVVGREGNSVYQESVNGIQVRDLHQFTAPIDPFIKEGNSSSGLLPGIENVDLSSQQGQGDRRVQAYCFRMSMTDDPALKIDWEKPDDFAPLQYELCGRWLRADKAGWNDLLDRTGEHRTLPKKFDVLPNKTAGGFHKTDTNNHGPVSSDFIGQNYEWPDGCFERREQIFQAHVAYQKGHYWHVANADGIPDRYRNAYRTWGLPKDEFAETDHWPHQLYIREARRMVGRSVLTEHVCHGDHKIADAIGMGSYNMDSHNCSRFVKLDNGQPHVMNDGDVQAKAVPYGISYGVITPKRGECMNLLVPVCLSASHIAYGSVRMEPVFMALGQSSAIAASMAIEDGMSVQDIHYEKLRATLLDARQVLEPT